MQLGNTLRAARIAAGFTTGKALAEHLGWQPSKVSRIENGQSKLEELDAKAWLQAVGASEEATARVLADLLAVRLEEDSWKRQLRTGHKPRQQRAASLEAQAAVITYVEFLIVPGLVQTADYARAVLTSGAKLHQSPRDTEEAVRARMERQGVLYDSTKRIEFLIGESALRYSVCPPSVMAAQIDRLHGLIGIEHIRFGIIPLDVRLEAVPMHGYHVLDSQVFAEATHTELTAIDPADLELYQRLTGALWSSAVEGSDARKLLRRVAERFADA